VLIVGTIFAQDTVQKIIPNRHNDKIQQKKPYVVLISADGFRYDYVQLFKPPFLQSIATKGVVAEYMQPSYPSLTFPNHYTIATGMYPSHHGLVDNNFFDKRLGIEYSMMNKKIALDSTWYGGTPLWVLAEKQKMLTANFYWVGSESSIQNTRPTYYYSYNEKIDIRTRIKIVKDWLSLPEDQRPHLITFYLPQVDHDAHNYGTLSPEVAKDIAFVDSAVNALQASLAPLHLPINYIFLSDHGLTDVDRAHPLSIPSVIDTTQVRIPWGETVLHLYFKDSSKIESTYTALKKDSNVVVYKLDETPDYWHVKKSDDRYHRFGDMIILPRDKNKVFNLTKYTTSPAKHGQDNHLLDMRASFMAWGPAFKNGLSIQGFENIHVYPLIAHILGLQYDENAIDGKFSALAPILK
jgi:predicted AlkP superfamily pyrophosphatase or phosphodiesterase